MCQTRLTNALARLDAINLNQLSLDQIVELQDRTRSAIDTLASQIEADASMAEVSVSEHDPFAFQSVKRLSAKHQTRAEHLIALQEDLDNLYQRKYMEKGMADRLGGPQMVKRFESLVLVLIVFVLGLLVYDLTAGPDDTRPALLSSNMIFMTDAICCLVFMSEFILRLVSADSRKYVWKNHWVDFITSIPIPGEAQLARFGRFARIARFARLLRLLRFARLFFFLWRGLDKLQDLMDVKVMKKTIRWSVFATIAGAIAIYKIEGTSPTAPDNPVSTFAKSAWWSFTTVLTGGFGDIHNPVSVSGQVLTGFLVVIGMVLVGVFTATLTSIFVGERQDNEDISLEQISAKLDALQFNTVLNPADGPDQTKR